MINPNAIGENISEQISNDDGPWGRKYQESVPPFNPGQTQEITEVEDYYFVDGVEQRNLNTIDISTEQGKYEYLDSLVDNAEQWHEENSQEDDENRAVVARQRRILQNLDINNQTVEKALEQRIAGFDKIINNPSVSNESQSIALEDKRAAQDLYSILNSEISKRNPENPQETQKEPPVSYHFEGGLVDKDATITVGQEIPDEWFESKTHGDDTGSGLGVKIVRPSQIEDYLHQALNIEFGKLSEDERRRYDYPALSRAIMAEAKRTKKIPDIISIINRQRT
ncbi:hypothetical protein IKF57_01130 [Candidatus Saccharibacteria bacterium]|nr:hypothetical protein [Candidatus Saccharibacteria bacterium]MBR3180121.1 hypothetical protein [Candidatus Saccharibacteria bacterium]